MNSRHRQIKRAFSDSIPVMASYLLLSAGFGIVLQANGYGVLWSLSMGAFICTGAMQYVVIDFLSAPVSLLTAFLTTIVINARLSFFGLSLIDSYKDKKHKPFLFFSLTDATFSLACAQNSREPDIGTYFFFVSLFDYGYWIIGCLIGTLLGPVIPFSAKGMEFSLTALFITVFMNQWEKEKNHVPALTGIAVPLFFLILLRNDYFLIPAMAVIIAIVSLPYKQRRDEK